MGESPNMTATTQDALSTTCRAAVSSAASAAAHPARAE